MENLSWNYGINSFERDSISVALMYGGCNEPKRRSFVR